MLHKLAKFDYQTVFTSQVIQWNVFCVSCLGIWWLHDFWISENLTFDYLKNEKRFRNETKNIFPCKKCKLASKNLAGTTFNIILLSFC